MEAGIPLTRHPDVSMIAFTGGESAGTGVYHAAADGLRHLSLQLGGKLAIHPDQVAVINDAFMSSVAELGPCAAPAGRPGNGVNVAVS